MSNLDRAIASAKLVVAAAEALTQAIHTARKALEDGTAKLKEALAEAEAEREKDREQLEHDRTDADTALDEKFRGG